MRIAVFSDIHGNLHALEAVLRAIDEERPDAIWCLGDIVGYGPRPNECCETVQERADICLVGNHDLVVTGALSVSEFNEDAGAAALWTADVLTKESRGWLDSLEPLGTAEGVQLFHASARDPVWEYVLTEEAARASLEVTDAPVVLVGHSHVALGLTVEDGKVRGGLAPEGTQLVLFEGRWLLNPGSVGQPRDGDPRAAYLLLEPDRGLATFHRVHYPIEETQAEIRERGLPEALAARLARGE
jgi:predicted phosphodiesterase